MWSSTLVFTHTRDYGERAREITQKTFIRRSKIILFYLHIQCLLFNFINSEKTNFFVILFLVIFVSVTLEVGHQTSRLFVNS